MRVVRLGNQREHMQDGRVVKRLPNDNYSSGILPRACVAGRNALFAPHKYGWENAWCETNWIVHELVRVTTVFVRWSISLNTVAWAR